MEKGKEVGPLIGEYLPASGAPQEHSFELEDIYGADELINAMVHLEDVLKTIVVNPKMDDGVRILPDIFNPDGTLNEAAVTERNRRIEAVRARQKIQSDVDDFVWRVGMPLLGVMLIGIAVMTRFI